MIFFVRAFKTEIKVTRQSNTALNLATNVSKKKIKGFDHLGTENFLIEFSCNMASEVCLLLLGRLALRNSFSSTGQSAIAKLANLSLSLSC